MILYYESLKIPFDHYKDHWIFQYVWVRQENVSLFIGWALGCEFCAFYFAVHWTAIDYHLNPYSIFACTLPRCRVHASPIFPTQKSTLGRGSKYPSIRNTGSDFSYRSVSSIHRSTSPNGTGNRHIRIPTVLVYIVGRFRYFPRIRFPLRFTREISFPSNKRQPEASRTSKRSVKWISITDANI